MGELSERIGEKLEHYGSELFRHMGWEVLAQNVQITCTHRTHKNSKDDPKTTHGIDILVGYDNPFSAKKEALVIECKHREWKNFNKSNLTLWVNELCNTIECASTSPIVLPLLKEYTLVGGILFFNSSDNKYDAEKAMDTMATLTVPRRRHPLMLYIADNNRLDQWVSLNSAIDNIKQESINHEFNVIYPSIGGSSWERIHTLTPSYLFSDFILGSYTKMVQGNYGITAQVDIKTVFCFDSITEDGLKYLKSMINELQLEARNERPQEMHFYFYPESGDAIERIKALTSKLKSEKDNYRVIIMDNRNVSRINYPNFGGDQ